MEEDSKVLIDQTFIIVKKLENKAKMFSNGMLVLSLFDCLFGILAIFCTSLSMVAFFASATSLTAITMCGRVIQIRKIQVLEKSLKPFNAIAVAWFVNRYRKYLKNKGEGKMKTEKLSGIQIASIVGAIVGIVFAIVSVFVPQIAIAGDCIYNILIATGVEGLCAFAGTFKGYKKMTEDEIAKVQEKAKAKEEAKKLAEVEKAKTLVQEYEAAKKIIAEAEKHE